MNLVRLILCLCLGALPTAALADPGDAIGSTVAVVNQVTGEFRQDLRKLSTGDDVVQEEVIAAGANSIAELMLRDQTKLAIGPGARMTLDRFIYDPNKTSGAIVLNLIKGGFRFITGVAAKPFYCDPHAGRRDNRQGHDLRRLYRRAGPGLAAAARRIDPRLQHARRMPDRSMILAACCASAPTATLQDPGTWNALPQTREVNFDDSVPVRRQRRRASTRRRSSRAMTSSSAAALSRRSARPTYRRFKRFRGQGLAGTAGKEKAAQEVCLFQAAPQDVPALPAQLARLQHRHRDRDRRRRQGWRRRWPLADHRIRPRG